MQRTVLTGVFAALLAVLSQIAIPLPTGVPITLQTFAVALCGYVLGPGMGALSVGVYLALGAAGQGPVCVMGSLYQVGEAYNCLHTRLFPQAQKN